MAYGKKEDYNLLKWYENFLFHLKCNLDSLKRTENSINSTREYLKQKSHKKGLNRIAIIELNSLKIIFLDPIKFFVDNLLILVEKSIRNIEKKEGKLRKILKDMNDPRVK